MCEMKFLFTILCFICLTSCSNMDEKYSESSCKNNIRENINDLCPERPIN